MSRKRKSCPEPGLVCESWSKRLLWTIDDFMRRASSTEVGESLCSPVFTATVEGFEPTGLTFQLEVFPNGEKREDNRDNVGVFLTSRRQEDLEVKYDFSVLKSDGTYWSRSRSWTFDKFSPKQNSWGIINTFSKAKLMEQSNELLPGGRLTIVCNLEIYYSDKHTQGKIPKFEFKFEEQSSLGDNMANWMAKAFNNLEYSDVTIICGDETEEVPNVAAAAAASGAVALASPPPAAVPSTFAASSSVTLAAAAAAVSSPPSAAVQQQQQPPLPNPNVRRFACHKMVLAARSDVFAAMFSHKATTESTTNEVHIRDTEPDILEQLLYFVYTDKINEDNILQSASGLLTAADKYNIPRLKTICEEAMCENIEVSNAAEVLILGYLHEAKNLQSVAVEFVTTNLSRVSETPGWKVILESHPKIMKEVLMTHASKFNWRRRK